MCCCVLAYVVCDRLWQVLVSNEGMASKPKQPVSCENEATSPSEDEESSPDETTSTKCKFFCWLLSSNRIGSESQLYNVFL